MKLQYLRLSEKGMQVYNGRLRQDLSVPQYELEFLSNIRSVKIVSPDWKLPIYVPLEQVANYTPLPSEIAGYKTK